MTIHHRIEAKGSALSTRATLRQRFTKNFVSVVHVMRWGGLTRILLGQIRLDVALRRGSTPR